MKGCSIAGMSVTRDRVEDDFYATPLSSLKALNDVFWFTGSILEPACGDGAISKFLSQYFHSCEITSTDLIYRGHGEGNIDFLTHDFQRKYNYVITNPPFSLFTEFVKRGLELAENKVILFGKLQALEGEKRASYLQTTPLKTVYVFKKRQNPLRNGSPVDEKGKPWASTMAFAWFVWEIGYEGKPSIEWI